MTDALETRDSVGLRPAPLIALLVGAVGSGGFTLCAGRVRLHSPALLATAFVVWVCTPFLGAMLAYRISGATSGRGRALIEIFIFVLSAVSLAVYGVATFAGARPIAPVFIMMPPASWIAIALALAGARKIG